MQKKLIEILIEKCRQGDYGLLEKVISNVHERPLMQVLPTDIKNELASAMIGQPMYVVVCYKGQVVKKQLGFIDAEESIGEFDNCCKNESFSKIQIYKARVVGGNESMGWIYSMEDAELLSEKVLDLDLEEGRNVSIVVSYRITGKLKKSVSNEELLDHLQETLPLIHLNGFMGDKVEFEGAKINFQE